MLHGHIVLSSLTMGCGAGLILGGGIFLSTYGIGAKLLSRGIWIDTNL